MNSEKEHELAFKLAVTLLLISLPFASWVVAWTVFALSILQLIPHRSEIIHATYFIMMAVVFCFYIWGVCYCVVQYRRERLYFVRYKWSELNRLKTKGK